MSWTSDGNNDDNRPRDPYSTPPAGEQPPPYEPPPDQPPAWSGTAEPAFGAPVPAGPPKPLETAVKLMYVGAGLEAIKGIGVATNTDEIRDAAIDSVGNDSGLSASDLDSIGSMAVGFSFAIPIIAILLWLWMAAMNKKGKLWARVTATVFGALNIISMVFSLTSGGGIGLVINLVSLALAAYILYLLYRPESTAYYTAKSRRL